MLRYSLLDLCPVPEGSTPVEALAHSLDLARMAETEGYHRFWVAEHHAMPGIASSATAVVIGQLAAATKTIRIGSGGIMLPNHAPLVIAEQFGTLASFFPGRIDLGLGRAPGTDMRTMRALRRGMDGEDAFPSDVMELIGYLSDAPQPIRAIPGEGTKVPVWILGSSLYGAQMAAHFGLPYAFASHFAPEHLGEALLAYRSGFRPSEWLDQPYAMMAVGVHAAQTDDEARFLRSSQLLAFARLRSGQPGRLPCPLEDVSAEIPPQLLAGVERALSVSAVGSPETVAQRLAELVETWRPDEIMLTGMIHDPAKRIRSFEIAARAMREIVPSYCATQSAK